MSALKPSVIQLVPQEAAHGRLGDNILGRDGPPDSSEGVDSDKQVTRANGNLLGLEDAARTKTVLLMVGKRLIERKTIICHA